jgi:hypothetical protein
MKDRHIYGIVIILMSAANFAAGWDMAAERGHEKLKECWAESAKDRTDDLQHTQQVVDSAQQAVDIATDCYKALNAVLPSADAGARPVAKK